MRRSYGDYDPGMVDELAVEFAANGTPMRLNPDERVVLTRMLAGRCTTGEIARRSYGCAREIMRILSALGGRKCGFCNQLALIDDNGDYTSHINYRTEEICPMTGHPVGTKSSVVIHHRGDWQAAC